MRWALVGLGTWALFSCSRDGVTPPASSDMDAPSTSATAVSTPRSTATPAEASPSVVASARASGLEAPEAVAAALLAVEEARKAKNVAALRALLILPVRKAWKANDGMGDCVVPQNRSFSGPLEAASALAPSSGFVGALRRDRGRVREGSSCDPEGAVPFSSGQPAIQVTGDAAKVHYEDSVCGAGGGSHTYTLGRVEGVWRLSALDDGCHYDEDRGR